MTPSYWQKTRQRRFAAKALFVTAGLATSVGIALAAAAPFMR